MTYTISDIKKKTEPIARNYGIHRMSLFRSYARGEAKEGSDIDIYIDKGELRNLIQYFSFIDELEKTLNCHVDVVTTGIQDKEFLRTIKSEGVLLYEK